MMTKLLFGGLLAIFAQLTVGELVGFGASAAGPGVELSISSSTNNYDICAAIQGAGTDPAAVANGTANITLSNAVIVGSTSTANPAMETGDCGSSWSPGWTVTLLVTGSNSARIQGAGGNGGQGSLRGTIFEGCETVSTRGGGGGGGSGTSAGSGANANGSNGTASAGGSGGTNSFGNCSSGGAFAGSAGGPALEATTGGPDIRLAPAASATLEVWGGGGGGGGSLNGTGGDGGDPGQDGDSSSAAGGANGVAYSEPGSASVVEVGPGTIDDLGT